MKHFTLFLIVVLALSVAADYTTNVTVVETIDSPAVEIPTPTESANVTVIEETVPTEVPFAPSSETPLPTDESTEIPTGKPTDVPTSAPTSEPTGAPTAVPTKVPTETPVPTETLAAADIFTQETLGTTNETPIPTETATEVPTSVPTDSPTEIPFSPVEEIPVVSTLPGNSSVSFGPVKNDTVEETIVIKYDDNLTVIETIEVPASAPYPEDALDAMLENLSNHIDSKTTAQLPVENTSADPGQLPVNISETAILTETPTETPTIEPTQNVSVNVSGNISPLVVYDADGNIVSTSVDISGSTIIVEIAEGGVQEIMLFGAENISALPRVDDVPTNFSSPVPGTTWVQVYAIDPTNTSFDRGLVEVVAAGTKLYKCKDWNFDARSCGGSWVLVAEDMVPGNTYYLDIDPMDPAFGEIVATAAVHLDGDDEFISDIFEQIRAEDNIWSEPIPSGHKVRVTFETALDNGNVIDFIGRTNGSLVDVEIYAVDTGTLVGASRRFDRQMHAYVELSGVPSPTDTFDLKIIGLPTPECSPDDDCGFTDSIPLMEFDFINDAAISATGADGVVAYSSAGVAAPRYRQWNRTTQAWGSQANTLTNTAESTWIVMKSSHQYNQQFLMGALQTDTNISLQIGNGNNGTSNTTNWTQRFNLSFDVPSIARRSLDIAIEDISGDGIVVFETAAGGDSVFALREWNGTALGPNITVNISPPAGGVLWLRAIPRPQTDEVMILALTSNADLWATYWTGSGLLNNTGFNITLDTGITTFEVFDFAWQANGDGLIVYRQGAQTQIQLRTFNGTNKAWSANSTLMTLNSGVPQAMSLCADPTSNYIGFISHDSTNDANVRIWNGTGVETSPAPPAENINLEPTAAPARNVDCAWMADGSNATFVFVLAPGPSDDLFAYVMYNKTAWNPGSLATPSTSTSVTGGPSIEELDLVPNPVRREIQAVVLDATASADLFSAVFNFTNWAVNPAGNYLLEGTVTAACAGITMCAGFDWDQFDPVPNITIIMPLNNSNFSNGSTVNITVNVTDNLNVSNVTVNITQPDNTVVRLNLSLFQGNLSVGNWSVNFVNTSVPGRYNFTVCANDTSTHNNVNCTSGFFNIGTQVVMNIFKSGLPNPVSPGGSLRYVLTINNTGTPAAYNVTVVESYPGNVTFNSSQPAPTSGNNTWNLGTIFGGNATTINITLNVSRAINNVTLFNFVNLTFANDSGQNFTLNTSQSTFVVGANITLRKFDAPDPVVKGSILTYLIHYNVSFLNVSNNLSLQDVNFITNDSINHDSPNAIKTTNGSFIVVFSQGNGSTRDIYTLRSVDNGQTYTRRQLTFDTVNSELVPNIMQANDNTIYVVYVNTSGADDIYIINSTDDGQSWGGSRILINTTTVTEFEPSLEQNSSGMFFLLYEAVIAPDTDFEIWIRNSTNLVNWSAPINLSNNSISDFDPDILIGVNDTVYITWAPALGVGGAQIILLVNTTNPLVEGLLQNYTVITNTTLFDYEPSIFQSNLTSCGGLNNLYISWVRLLNSSQLPFSAFNRTSNDIFVARSLDLGVTFTTFRLTDNNVSDTYPGLVQEGSSDFFRMYFLRGGSSEMEVAQGTVGTRSGDAFNVTITDVIPDNTTLVNGSIIGGGNVSGNTITWFFPQLFECESGFVGFSVRVNESLTNGTVINNSANVTYFSFSGVNNTGNASANTTVRGIPVTVTIKNDSPDPVAKGALLNYTIFINNTGDEIAYNVTLVDTYPPNVTFVSSSPSPTSGNGTWSLGNLTPNQSTTVNITVRVSTILTNGTTITNLANATFANLSGVNASASDTETTTVIGIPQIFADKSDTPDPVVRGQTLNYTILVNNTGDEIAYNVTLVEMYPGNVSFVTSSPAPTSGNNTFSLGNLSPNQSTTVNISVIVGSGVLNGSVLVNFVNVTFTNLSGQNASVNDTELTTVIGFPEVFANKLDSPDPVVNGTTLSYQILITNTGDEIAYNVTVFDLYPISGVTFNGSTPSPNVSNNTWFLGALLNGSSVTINITVNVSASNGTVLNNSFNATFANFSGTNLTITNSTTTIVQGVPFLVSIKSDTPDPVVRGQMLNYTILVNNTGDEVAYNVTLVETYPGNVSFVSSLPAPTSGNNTFSLGNLSPNQSVLVNISVMVGVTVLNGTVLTNFVNATFSNLSGQNASASDTESTTVIGFGVVNVTKTASPSPVTSGSLLSYTITVTNSGDEIAYNVTVVEDYPVNVSFVSSSPAPDVGNNTFLLGNLTPGASTTVNITVSVSGSMTSGILTNLVNVTFTNATGTNETVNTTTNTTVVPFVPPPPSGGGGSTGARSALIVPPPDKCVEGIRTFAGTTCCSDSYCKQLGSAWRCSSGPGLRVCVIDERQAQPSPALVEKMVEKQLTPAEARKGLLVASLKREWPWLMALIAISLIILLVVWGFRENKKRRSFKK
ncbi:MAG: PT domain-containing protein [Candidatus Woesearchaeota archaeon]